MASERSPNGPTLHFDERADVNGRRFSTRRIDTVEHPASISPESGAWLVLAAVFKTVDACHGRGGFNSLPLRFYSK